MVSLTSIPAVFYEMLVFIAILFFGVIYGWRKGGAPVEMRLGQGYEPGRGNSPADSVFERVLPNALTAKSDELFALARKVVAVDAVLRPGVLRHRDDQHPHVAPRTSTASAL